MFRTLGWIKLFPYNFAPPGWTICDGSLLDIGENDALFSLLRDTFGGDDATNFAVPDLRAAAPRGCNYCISLQGAFPVGNYENAFVGETMIVAFDPDLRDLVECAGQQLPKSRFMLLDRLLGDRFGGDAASLKLPDLRKSAPAHCRYMMATAGDYPSEGASRRESFIGEIVLLPTDSAPGNFTTCDGKLLEPARNQALFSLLGNRFGGDGQRNFALPDLRPAAPEKFNYFIALRGMIR